MKQTNLPDLLTPRQIADYLHIGNDKLYSLMKQKSFPSFKLGSRYYVRKDRFEEWMDNQTKKLFQ